MRCRAPDRTRYGRILACARSERQARTRLGARHSLLTHAACAANRMISRRNSSFGTLFAPHGLILRTVVTSPAFLPERVSYGCDFSPIAGHFRPRVTPLDAGAFLFARPQREGAERARQ